MRRLAYRIVASFDPWLIAANTPPTPCETIHRVGHQEALAAKIEMDRDASFIRALGSDLHAVEIVRAVVRMSHAMGIRVNAEGVEHEYQAKLLREKGCEEVQGFLYSKALSATDFGELLAPDLAQRPAVLAMAIVA